MQSKTCAHVCKLDKKKTGNLMCVVVQSLWLVSGVVVFCQCYHLLCPDRKVMLLLNARFD